MLLTLSIQKILCALAPCLTFCLNLLGSNPIWMSNVAYDNMSFEDDDDNLDDNFLERLNHDSLDVNVLNCANLNTLNRSEDDGYAGSTLRVGSSMNKTLMNMPTNSKYQFPYICQFQKMDAFTIQLNDFILQ